MKKLLVTALIVAGLSSTAMADVDKDAVINYRQSLFSVIGWNMGSLGAMAKGEVEYNQEEAVAAAERLHVMAKAVEGTIVDGTFEGSNAKPEIAEKREAFDKILADLVKESEAMVTAAGEKNTLGPQMGKLGATCKTCHDDFKLD